MIIKKTPNCWLKIHRIDYSANHTIGVLTVNGSATGVFTMEPPWRQNAYSVSCIPAGIYRAVKYKSPTKGDVFYLQDVPGRTYIYIHPLNLAGESDGCIGVGDGIQQWSTGMAVMNSDLTFKKLFFDLPDEIMIEII